MTNFPLTTSFWGTASADPSLRLEGEHEADVVVVGAGLAGMSAAYFLRTMVPGLRVWLVEAEYAGWGNASRNMGNVPQLARNEIGRLENAYGEAGAQLVVDTQATLLERFEGIIRQESIECGFTRVNCLINAITPNATSGLERLTKLHAKYGFPSVMLTAEETRQEIGCVSYGSMTSGRNGAVDPFRLARGLRDAVLRSGVQLGEDTKIDRIEDDAQGVTVFSAGGRIRAHTAVISVNGFGYKCPPAWPTSFVTPMFTSALATVPLDRDTIAEMGWGTGRHRIVMDAGPMGTYYAVQVLPDGTCMIEGGMGKRFVCEEPPLAECERLYAELTSRFPVLQGVEIAAAWGGPLAMTPRGTATIDWASEHVIVNMGWNGKGVLMATTSGLAVVGMLYPDLQDPELERYRKLIHSGSQAGAR